MEALKKSRLIVLAISTIFPATSALAGAPQFVHHDEQASHEEESHYSDKGEHPSKAERLGVVLLSRILLNKAGVSDLEVTTGKLDSTATPPGNIDKLEVVALAPAVAKTKGEDKDKDDKEAFEKKYNHLKAGGYAHYAYTNLVHGQTVKVEAEVSGFGHGRERVEMDLTDVVKYRPDLAVEKLDYPTTARPNTVVPFAAVVSERMRDVGAHTDCVLLVDGKQVDAAKGIWIDAATTVSCSFGYRFTAAGLHTVTVRAQNTLPGDYDGSNNEMSGQILIKSPAALFYSANALESTWTLDRTQDYYYSAASLVPDEHVHENYASSMQNRFFHGDLPMALTLPLKKVSFADSSDGVALSSLSFTDVAADSTGPSGNAAYTTESLIQRYDAATAGWLLIHRYENANTGAGSTTIDVTWYAGLVTYHSDSFCSVATGYKCWPGAYTRNTTTPTPDPRGGPLVKLGSGYAADVVLDDGTAYSAHPNMTLVPLRQSYNSPASCFALNYGGATPGKMCMQSTSLLVAKSGNDVLSP
jgi:hypothetical protein